MVSLCVLCLGQLSLLELEGSGQTGTVCRLKVGEGRFQRSADGVSREEGMIHGRRAQQLSGEL